MNRQIALLVLMLCCVRVHAADPVRAVVQEAKRYAHDARDLAVAPARWKSREWARFGAGVALVAATYAADEQLYRGVQRNRTRFSDDFSKAITPFGGGRAQQVSALLIVAGSLSNNARMRDAGRDSLEAEILAAGIVTPLLKRGFGRARPIQDEGAHSFYPFTTSHQSFPSGHATNAFALATAISGHYDNWVVPTIAYSIASGVAFSRVNDRAHFPSDVVAGALIGSAIARGLVYRHTVRKTAFTLTPAMVGGAPGLMVHLERDAVTAR